MFATAVLVVRPIRTEGIVSFCLFNVPFFTSRILCVFFIVTSYPLFDISCPSFLLSVRAHDERNASGATASKDATDFP
jgi:hypothetical protein